MRNTVGRSAAEHLRLVAHNKRTTQREIADALGVPQSAVSRRLNGQTALTVDDLIVLARLLDLDPAAVITAAVDLADREVPA